MCRFRRSEAIYVNTLWTLLIVILYATAEEPPRKWPIGKETTHITEPVDNEGYIDYETGLNDRLGKGIMPEKNANVLIWKALGPRPEGGEGMPAEFFERLGMEEPPEKGDYFVSLKHFAKNNLGLQQDKVESLEDQFGIEVKRVWSAEDYPDLAAWVRLNDKPLDLTIEASKRLEYFNPLISPRIENRPSGIMRALMPGVRSCQELGSGLATRATLRCGEGRFDEAWSDMLACHRLGRLVSRGGTLYESHVGLAINQIALDAELVYLDQANLTAIQVQDRLRDLQGLPPASQVAEVIDQGERFMFLNAMQDVRRSGFQFFRSLGFHGFSRANDRDEEKAMARLDWEPAMRSVNQVCDRMVVALRNKDRSSRIKELDAIGWEAEKSNCDAQTHFRFFGDFDSAKSIGDYLFGHRPTGIGSHLCYSDRLEQEERNLCIAFALAAYHCDNRAYPAKLNDLAPKYLPSIPDDLFSGKPLIYRTNDQILDGLPDKGYFFYSVGINGKDDNGRTYGDDTYGDDIVVQMPLPKLKAKK